MEEFKLITPVVFIIFNRPETTQRVFEEIRKAKPSKLLVIADGPRDSHIGEKEHCDTTRKIIEKVDWDCEVIKNYSDINLGCKKRVSTGLNWVFENVEEAIILEDDVLPHQTFFRFCEELLEKHRHNENIMLVSGANVQFGRNKSDYSYFFSQYCFIWGWATWKRAWKNYDIEMKSWPEARDNGLLKEMFNRKAPIEYWKKIFDDLYAGKVDTWDGQWVFSCWIRRALTIQPNVNLISNIGFGIEATHTKSENMFSNMQIEHLQFPIKHPPNIIRALKNDTFTEKIMFSSTFIRKVLYKLGLKR